MRDKQCTECGRVKILCHFPKDKKSADGRRVICKVCNYGGRRLPDIHDIVARVKASRGEILLPVCDVSCDHEDYYQTMLWKNHNFIPGDAGYGAFISQLPTRATPQLTYFINTGL